MKRTFAFFLGLAAAALPVRADLCALDHVPAATLLLPYFEVDLNGPAGRTTLFSINNSGAGPALAHVVLWTDLAVPTITFDVYLTGYDVETINLRDVLTGRLPRTADLARDPADTVSPKGAFSQDATFPGCVGLPPVFPPDLIAPLQSAHTGQPSPLQVGQCAGLPHGDTGIARGYVTIDVATRCSYLSPRDPGYFGAGGVAGFDNVLWGDFFYVDPSGRFAEGDNLVRIEADPHRFAGKVTFYGRYVNGSGADGREPLPTLWAARFLTGGAFDGGTDLVAWREVPWNGVPFACGTRPAGFPLAQKELIAFDEEEHPVIYGPPPFPEFPPLVTTPFAAAATRVKAGGASLPVPYNFGWFLADLASYVNAPADPYSQGWVGQVSTSRGRYSVGFQGTALNSLCAPDRCPAGQETATGQLCVGPTAVGSPAHFTVAPKGCFSNSCNRLAHAGCAVVDEGASLRLDSLICIVPIVGTDLCLNDCSGINATASCDSGPLAAGIYTARLGGLQVNFQVPSATPACVTSP